MDTLSSLPFEGRYRYRTKRYKLCGYRSGIVLPVIVISWITLLHPEIRYFPINHFTGSRGRAAVCSKCRFQARRDRDSQLSVMQKEILGSGWLNRLQPVLFWVWVFGEGLVIIVSRWKRQKK